MKKVAKKLARANEESPTSRENTQDNRFLHLCSEGVNRKEDEQPRFSGFASMRS